MRSQIADQGICESAQRCAGNAVITKRQQRRFRNTTTAFVPAGTGVAAAATEGSRRVFVLGKVPPAAELIGHVSGSLYLDGHAPIVNVDGCSVSWASGWFGDGEYGTDDCSAVWADLCERVRRAWRDEGATLLLTPATTGRDLWVRTVPDEGYPVMSADMQTLVRSGAGQGRMEVMPRRAELMPEMFGYDMRISYAAHLDRLPIGEPVQLGAAAAAHSIEQPYAPGRYLVTFRAPEGWRHPGVLPTPVTDGAWSWPTTHRWHGPSWVDAIDLFYARQHGWDVIVSDGLVWPAVGNPFRVWARRLMDVMNAAQEHWHGNGQPLRARMARAAVRGVLLFGLGAMHGAPRRMTHVGDSPLGDAISPRRLRSGAWLWHTIEQPAWPELVHPEWTAAIWSRARARLLSGPNKVGALHIDPAHVVAFRTDAVYTTHATGWEQFDDGAPGRYTTPTRFGPMPWPRTGTDIVTARVVARG
jgi:hypothetical protein